jgi:hypothetical protein
VEEVRDADGYHQALLWVPSNGSESAADGPIWRETINRYVLESIRSVLWIWERLLILSSRLGTLFKASQFLSEELPIRLAHRVQELGDLPDGLNEMPSIKKVQDWYAQSFEVIHTIHYTRLEMMVDM